MHPDALTYAAVNWLAVRKPIWFALLCASILAAFAYGGTP